MNHDLRHNHFHPLVHDGRKWNSLKSNDHSQVLSLAHIYGC